MDSTAIVAVGIIALAVVGVFRGLDVRLVLLAAALALASLTGDIAPIVRTFLITLSDEKFVLPICTAMGFAYVLKHTGCDTHLVQLLVAPLRKVRFLLVPGVVCAGFVVNIPVISQTSTAVCLGTVVVPLMRAAGFSNVAIGSTLLLGASVGGELLNPGAPELNSVREKVGGDVRAIIPFIIPLLAPLFVLSTITLWILIGWREKHTQPEPTTESAETPTPVKVNLLRAMVPLVPLALLFFTGPPLELMQIPQRIVVNRPLEEPSMAVAGPALTTLMEAKKDPYFSGRLIGLAMLIGVAVAAIVTPKKAGGCMKAFFEGAGYAFTNVISLIVVANCFGEATRHADSAISQLINAPRRHHADALCIHQRLWNGEHSEPVQVFLRPGDQHQCSPG
jgi:C4-dicarboxylate transporter, DcuC family